MCFAYLVDRFSHFADNPLRRPRPLLAAACVLQTASQFHLAYQMNIYSL